MNYEALDELIEKIQEITGLNDVAYHEIGNGRINPVYKTNTDILGVERWKSGHNQNPVYINATLVLQQIISSKNYVYISNTKQDSRSSEAFFFFGVDSILIVPVLQGEDVKGIICIVSIGETYDLTEDQIESCVNLVSYYKERL